MSAAAKSSIDELIWLASYPRSGNTFLRTVLWNCFGLKSASVYPQDMGKNSQLMNYVGHIEHSGNGKIVFPSGAPKLLKTHEFPKNDKPAIYIVRDGRAACASLFHFYNGAISMENIIAGKHRFGSWSGNVEAWAPWNRPNTLLLKYESLRDNLEQTLEIISGFLKKPILNKTVPSREDIAGKDGKWVRKRSNWRDDYSEDLLNLFYQINQDSMRRLDYECPPAKVHTFDNGVKLYDHHLLEVQRKRYLEVNLHEPEEESIFTEIILGLDKGQAYFDVGAAVGYYVILANKLRGEDIQISAFEPLPLQANRLEDTLKLNGIVEDNVSIHRVAMSNKAGTASLTDCSYASGIVKEPTAFKGRTILVKTETIDSLLEKSLVTVGLLQIDVQGHELSVLRGASKSLWQKKIHNLLIGTHGFALHENCMQFLLNRGYSIKFEEFETQNQPDGIIHACVK